MSSDARHPQYQSFVDVLRSRAADSPEALAFCYLIDGEEEGPRLTYADLDQKAQQIAIKIREVAGPGDRVLLVYPSGLEFISAFFGCVYANVIAVLASPPRLDRALQSVLGLTNISNDCKPSVVLTGGSDAEGLIGSCSGISSLEGLPWIVTDQLDSGSHRWVDPHPNDHDVAILQYTSGSTRTPRGVMLTHSNLLHNEQMMQLAFCHNDYPEYGVGICWLPLHHDMGLFGNMLQTVYVGAASYLMSPLGLLQKPFRWLQAISKYRADSSGGPNFAFELCVRKITPEQRSTLDLYNWSIACVGAEPIRPKVLDAFAETFESCRFYRETFYPAYGLAEATLFVTGGDKGTDPVIRRFDAGVLELHPSGNGLRDAFSQRTLVGCGRA